MSMLRSLFVLVFALALAAAAPALAQTGNGGDGPNKEGGKDGAGKGGGDTKGAGAQSVAGNYSITGSNPGGRGSYRGVVVVRQTGQTYVVAWQVGSQRYVGRGILYNGVFSVAYNGGLAVYSFDGTGNASGQWTVTRGTRLGTETWTRQ